jgi:hypothetical protein
MRKPSAVVVLTSVAAFTFIACLGWENWDKQFKRSAGWKDHDGGGSTYLPPVIGSGQGGRSLWLFGDGIFWRPGYTQPQNTAPTSDVKGLVGNTIAIHAWMANQNVWDAPLDGNLGFYARIKANANPTGPACGFTPRDWATKCPVQKMNAANDFPAGPPDTVGDAVSATGGFIPGDAELDANGDPIHFAWPKSAVYVSSPQQPTPFNGGKKEAFLVQGFQMKKRADLGLVRLGFSIMTGIEKGGPETWSYLGVTDIPVDTSIHQISWGNSLYYDKLGDRIRIYGEIRRGFWSWKKDMVLAVALSSADIADSNRWWYAYQDSSAQCPPDEPVCRPCQSTYPDRPETWSACYAPIPPSTDWLKDRLKRVADNIAGDFTVDRICYDAPGENGRPSVTGDAGCAFVLVHGGFEMPNGCTPSLTQPECALSVSDPSKANPRWIVVRTSGDDLSWPSSSHGSYGPTQSTYVTDIIADSNDWDRRLLCGENAGRQVRQTQAHDELSPPGTIALSWYINAGPNQSNHLWVDGETNKVESTRKSNLRAGALSLKNFRPWCTASGTCPPDASTQSCCGAAGQACCPWDDGAQCTAGLACNAQNICR